MDYLDSARRNSPLNKEYVGRKEAAASERQRLKAFYTHSKAEVNGDLLFVPIVSLTAAERRSSGTHTILWTITATIWGSPAVICTVG